MPPTFDREGALKSAEKALKLGRIDAAIAEYVRVVEAQPRDLNSANALGDLYVRAGQVDRGLGHYVRIADLLEGEGFYPKAAALYKKILKIRPGEESALLHLGDIAARQGLLADARQYFNQLAERRKARGDTRGAAELAIRIGTLDPEDLDARLLAAQAASGIGDTVTALRELRDVAQRMLDGRRAADRVQVLADVVALDPDDVDAAATVARAYVASGELERARPYLTPLSAGHDAALWIALAEVHLTSGELEAGRSAVVRAVQLDRAAQAAAIDLGCRLADTSADAGYQVVDAVADVAIDGGDFAAAAAALQAFTSHVRLHLVGLMRLVEICVDGRLEAMMYEAQAQLADAYLEVGSGLEARIISEDLVAREPWNEENIDRFRKALIMLGETDPDTIIADRLSGDSPFMAADFPDLNEGTVFSAESPVAPADAPPAPAASASSGEAALSVVEPGPAAIGNRDADWRIDAAAPLNVESGEAGAPVLVSQVEASAIEEEAAEQFRMAVTYYEMSMVEDAIASLEIAAKSRRRRFEAAAMLGRILVEQQQLEAALEWFDRAAEAPAPTADAGRALLYDLACALEAAGESTRALAVFAELEAESGGYRDVGLRIDELSKMQTR